MRPEIIEQIRSEFRRLYGEGMNQTWGQYQFVLGFFHGRGVTVEEIAEARKQMEDAGELPNVFDMIDKQDYELLKVRFIR